jgi:lysophospholipase L1-like esterase
MLGTNDWNLPECQDKVPCSTIDNLRTIVERCKARSTLVVLATIPPVNPAYVDKGAEARNDWVKQLNGFVRTMASQERVALAEIHGDMLKQPNLAGLFADDKHPNDAGYQVIAQSFFRAITMPVGATASARPRGFSFSLP